MRNHLFYNGGRMIKFALCFHRVILAFFLLIFLSACGYKGDPFYEIKDDNGSVKEIKEYKQINRW
ncbi:lipoprotein [Campylobacter sp. US33a]|uniref:lipoprotein n=1 Tax=Campylobacter sp. US33a TaxID=2498120 RepID=UPI001FBBCBC3|nr:lipoprotein [Campylobacter sp. US33a]MCW1360771.1 lipoprotein [Campylobacter jejuni]